MKELSAEHSTFRKTEGCLLSWLASPCQDSQCEMVMYGWLNGYGKNDSSASEVLKTAQYLAAFLGITVHVKHVPRMLDSLA